MISQTEHRMSDQVFFLRGATSCLKLSILKSCIRAVAENLDYRAWGKHHKFNPLKDSLDATDVAEKIANIPQSH
jgi:hypothetical protein